MHPRHLVNRLQETVSSSCLETADTAFLNITCVTLSSLCGLFQYAFSYGIRLGKRAGTKDD